MQIIATVLTLALALIAVPAIAQDAKLIEAAKKEGGKVVIYSSLESQVVDEVLAGFRKKTGLNAEYWRASAMSVMNRSMSEYRAGAPLYDIVMNNSDPLVIMANEGMIAKYDSPTAKKYPKEQIDPRLGPVSRYGIVGVVYHKGSIKAADAPKSLDDLVSPKYKGMLVMADPTLHVTTIQWLSSLHKIMAKERADKFIRDLAATKPTLVESMLPLWQSGKYQAVLDYVAQDVRTTLELAVLCEKRKRLSWITQKGTRSE